MRARIWRARRDARWLVRWASHLRRTMRRFLFDPHATREDVRAVWYAYHRASRTLTRLALRETTHQNPSASRSDKT